MEDTITSGLAKSTHYLRYFILGGYIAFLSRLPELLASDLTRIDVARLGYSLTVLCFVMDVRNYVKYRRLTDAKGFPLVSVLLGVFYFACFLWFVTLPGSDYGTRRSQVYQTPPSIGAQSPNPANQSAGVSTSDGLKGESQRTPTAGPSDPSPAQREARAREELAGQKDALQRGATDLVTRKKLQMLELARAKEVADQEQKAVADRTARARRVEEAALREIEQSRKALGKELAELASRRKQLEAELGQATKAASAVREQQAADLERERRLHASARQTLDLELKTLEAKRSETQHAEQILTSRRRALAADESDVTRRLEALKKRRFLLDLSPAVTISVILGLMVTSGGAAFWSLRRVFVTG